MDISTIRKINGTYNKTAKEALTSRMVDEYNHAKDSLVTRFSVLINSKEAKNVVIKSKDEVFDSRVLIKYENSKNTTPYNFYAKVESFVNEVKTGTLIEYYDEVSDRKDIYLCTSKPMRENDRDINYVINCNQTLNYEGLEKPIPCFADNSSYGVKGVVNTTFYNEYDGKIRFFTQYNKETSVIRQDMRFIFDNSKDSVYKVADINRVVTGDVLRIVMDKDTSFNEKDDFENNIAYNGNMFKEKDIKEYDLYEIFSETGSMKIKRWTPNSFYIRNSETKEICKDFSMEIVDFENIKDFVEVTKNEDGEIAIFNQGYLDKTLEIKFVKEDLSYIVEVELVA